VFGTLAARMDDVPELKVRLFVHVERKRNDTRDDTMLLHEFAQTLIAEWPGRRRPIVYYDPRGLSKDADYRASWHAKCVIVDDAIAFVTSANFTDWAQMRNVEAGALVRSPHFAHQLAAQFDGLVSAGRVTRLPEV
jgi:phosphatidylserine/phosphatidylglycerophosphate/cardiolipin synthase-like enzyme